ncbi:hypothetical protein F5B17DRAFT_427747 [Nemania serpens]|nr:hypothetical protein F5B17DRAFT_427747 [Nemania serpens]
MFTHPILDQLHKATQEREEDLVEILWDPEDWARMHARVFNWIQGADNEVDALETPPTPPLSTCSVESVDSVVVNDHVKTRLEFPLGSPLSRVYSPTDFQVQNPHPTANKYIAMRLLMPMEIQSLMSYWARHLPMSGRILDFCASGRSHFPECYRAQAFMRKLFVTLCGPHPDLLTNPGWVNERHICTDFNTDAILSMSYLKLKMLQDDPTFWGFDAVTNVLTAHCLRFPLEVFSGLLQLTKPGGCIYLVTAKFQILDIPLATRVSNTCSTTMEKATMLCDLLRLAG